MIYFLIPIYNEVSNISELAVSLKGVMVDESKTYVFVDDGSSDGSYQLLESEFKNESIHILNNPGNQGPGYSFNAGFLYILDFLKPRDSDVIVTLEGDNTSDLGILPVMSMLNKQGYDLVLASPYAQGGRIENATFLRKVMSFFANLLLRIWFDIKVLTLSSFYRVYSPSLLRDIRDRNGEIITDKGFISQVEILVKAIELKKRIIEVPMILDSRKRKGKSKMKVLNTFLSYVRFFLQGKKSMGTKR